MTNILLVYVQLEDLGEHVQQGLEQDLSLGFLEDMKVLTDLGDGLQRACKTLALACYECSLQSLRRQLCSYQAQRHASLERAGLLNHLVSGVLGNHFVALRVHEILRVIWVLPQSQGSAKQREYPALFLQN